MRLRDPLHKIDGHVRGTPEVLMAESQIDKLGIPYIDYDMLAKSYRVDMGFPKEVQPAIVMDSVMTNPEDFYGASSRRFIIGPQRIVVNAVAAEYALGKTGDLGVMAAIILGGTEIASGRKSSAFHNGGFAFNGSNFLLSDSVRRTVEDTLQSSTVGIAATVLSYVGVSSAASYAGGKKALLSHNKDAARQRILADEVDLGHRQAILFPRSFRTKHLYRHIQRKNHLIEEHGMTDIVAGAAAALYDSFKAGLRMYRVSESETLFDAFNRQGIGVFDSLNLSGTSIDKDRLQEFIAIHRLLTRTEVVGEQEPARPAKKPRLLKV